MNLNTIYHNTEPISLEDSKLNKYLFMGYMLKLPHYRILTLHNVVNLIREKMQLPPSLLDMLKKHGRVLAIFNVVAGECCSLICRSIEGKEFFTLNKKFSIPYGIGMLSKDFKYGDTLVICEGAADRDGLVDCYPNIVAALNKRLSPSQLLCVLSLTNKVVLAYDCDKTGQKSFYSDKQKLEKYGVQVSLLKHPGKDAGEAIDYAMKGDFFRFNYYVERYKSLILNGEKVKKIFQKI